MQLPIPVENAVRHWRAQLSCSDPECRGSRRMWRRISDGGGSIDLHGSRLCFPNCFERELERRLDQMRPAITENGRPLHRIPLGLLMLSRGELDHAQLQKALSAQREKGEGRIGEWIEKLGFADGEQVTAAIAAQWCCPVLKSPPMHPVEAAIPTHLMRKFDMAPVHYVGATRIMHVAFTGGIAYRALLAIEQLLQCKAEPCITSRQNLTVLLDHFEEHRGGNDHVFENLRRREEIVRITSSYAAKLGAQKVRLAFCGEYLWLRLSAGSESANLLFSRTVQSRYLALGS